MKKRRLVAGRVARCKFHKPKKLLVGNLTASKRPVEVGMHLATSDVVELLC